MEITARIILCRKLCQEINQLKFPIFLSWMAPGRPLAQINIRNKNSRLKIIGRIVTCCNHYIYLTDFLATSFKYINKTDIYS